MSFNTTYNTLLNEFTSFKLNIIRELTPFELQRASHSHSQSSVFKTIKKYNKGWLAEQDDVRYIILPNYIEDWQGTQTQEYNIFHTLESTYKNQPVQLTLELTTRFWVNGHKEIDNEINRSIRELHSKKEMESAGLSKQQINTAIKI